MKITGVTANNRKRAFEVRTRRETLLFPYSKASPAPSPDDAVKHVSVDAELGREAFHRPVTSMSLPIQITFDDEYVGVPTHDQVRPSFALI